MDEWGDILSNLGVSSAYANNIVVGATEYATKVPGGMKKPDIDRLTRLSSQLRGLAIEIHDLLDARP
jgi:hypothetical protein